MNTAFGQVYDTEIGRFEQLKSVNLTDNEKINKMDLVCKELSMFMDKNAQERVINKINDISDFVNQSQEELEQIKAYNNKTNDPETNEL